MSIWREDDVWNTFHLKVQLTKIKVLKALRVFIKYKVEIEKCIAESEPSDRETEIWKELQITKVALSRAEEELRQSRADKDSFLGSLSRIVVNIINNVQDSLISTVVPTMV